MSYFPDSAHPRHPAAKTTTAAKPTTTTAVKPTATTAAKPTGPDLPTQIASLAARVFTLETTVKGLQPKTPPIT